MSKDYPTLSGLLDSNTSFESKGEDLKNFAKDMIAEFGKPNEDYDKIFNLVTLQSFALRKMDEHQRAFEKMDQNAETHLLIKAEYTKMVASLFDIERLGQKLA